jgi:hypothetical protein
LSDSVFVDTKNLFGLAPCKTLHHARPSALHHAVHDAELMELLLQTGQFDVNHWSYCGGTALTAAFWAPPHAVSYVRRAVGYTYVDVDERALLALIRHPSFDLRVQHCSSFYSPGDLLCVVAAHPNTLLALPVAREQSPSFMHEAHKVGREALLPFQV